LLVGKKDKAKPVGYAVENEGSVLEVPPPLDDTGSDESEPLSSEDDLLDPHPVPHKMLIRTGAQSAMGDLFR